MLWRFELSIISWYIMRLCIYIWLYVVYVMDFVGIPISWNANLVRNHSSDVIIFFVRLGWKMQVVTGMDGDSLQGCISSS